MPYLLRKSQKEIILIDYNLRSGLFYKSFVPNQFTRVYPILSSSSELYCAALDSQNKIHIACKNKRNQIIHIFETGKGLVHEILLDDQNNTYQITNFYMIPGKESLHLFYTALNPTRGIPEVIHHIVNEENSSPPQSFSPIADLNGHYHCLSHEEDIYFTSAIQNTDSFALLMHQFDEKNAQWLEPKELVKSQFPISFWKLCIDGDNYTHLIYIQDQYGQYRLNYKNLTLHTEQSIYSSAYELRPTLFIYHGAVWINWLEKNISKAVLSIDLGKSFSKPTSTTLQSEKILLYHYFYDQFFVPNLYGNQFYGYEGDYPLLSVLDKLDMDTIHIHFPANNELETYIASIKEQQLQGKRGKQDGIIEENNRLRSIQENVSTQYNQLAQFARQLQQEGKKWRSKYYDLEKKYNSEKKTMPQSIPKNPILSSNSKNNIDEFDSNRNTNTAGDSNPTTVNQTGESPPLSP